MLSYTVIEERTLLMILDIIFTAVMYDLMFFTIFEIDIFTSLEFVRMLVLDGH